MAPDISIIVPVLNEAESLPILRERLIGVLEGMDMPFEIIFIDDGSTDAGRDLMADLARADDRIGLIRFRRNFGKAAALDAGFRAARGRFVITMDADLQDDPDEVPRLIAKLEEGYDLVSGWKHVRHDPLDKTLPSKLFNGVVSWASGIKLHDFNCGLKAYRRETLADLSLYGELHRFIPVLAHWRGFRVTEMPVTHHPRQFGKSKFGAGRLVKGFLDLMTVMLITRYAGRPLHLFGLIGLILSALGFLCLAYLTGLWFLGDRPIGNRPLLMLGLLLMVVGVQFISTGLLGEMIRNTAQRRIGEEDRPAGGVYAVGLRVAAGVPPEQVKASATAESD